MIYFGILIVKTENILLYLWQIIFCAAKYKKLQKKTLQPKTRTIKNSKDIAPALYH
jgi:hypothetical protein